MNEVRSISPHSAAPRVLVVEDDSDLALLLTDNLQAEGYLTEYVGRGEDVGPKLAESPTDLLILESMLPGVSGFEVCTRLRAQEATHMLPIVIVAARSDEAERLRGFSAGADDYVAKPFSVPELMARVRALLRRSRAERVVEQRISFELHLDWETRCARRGLHKVQLPPAEFRLLESFLERPGRVFSRTELQDRIWGHAVGVDDRTVDVYVGRLRKALSRNLECDPIRTVRGSGYFFDQSLAPV